MHFMIKKKTEVLTAEGSHIYGKKVIVCIQILQVLNINIRCIFHEHFRASVIAEESTNRLVYVYSYLAHAIATKGLVCPSKQ